MTRRSREDLPMDWIEEDSVPAGPLRRHRRYPFFFVAAAGVLVAVVAVLPKGPAANTTTPTTTPPPTPTTATATAVVPLAAPVQTKIGRPLMAVPPGWELIGRGAELVRIELNAGRLTRTAIPTIDSSGPVYLVAGPDRVVIRPLDYVPGYVVPDGLPAAPLPGLLGHGGPAFPGPDSQHLWVDVDSANGRQMELVGFDGTPTGTIISSPNTFPDAPDGTGNLVFIGPNGASLARPGGSTRITAGQLLAAGATRWLTEECDARGTCRLVLTDRATGRARALVASTPANPPVCPPGPISPNGSVAALLEDSPGGPVLHLLDLATGRDRSSGARLAGSGCWDSMVWAPDGRALFFVDDVGALHVMDGVTERTGGLGIALPPMYQLAFRVKPGP